MGDDEHDDSSGSVPDDDDPMNPAAWYGEPDICGSCIAWRPEDPRPSDQVATGECKLRPEIGRVPATLKKCSIYKPRGQFRYDPSRAAPPPKRKSARTLRVLRRSADGELVAAKAPPRQAAPTILRREKDVEIEQEEEIISPTEISGEVGPRPERPVRANIPSAVDLGGDDSPGVVRQALVDLLRKEHKSTREIHSKYRTGGRVIARAANGREVEVTAERFFAMVDRFRASLDAFEALIERTPALAGDREEWVGYLKKAQGSFTTFNLMFQDRADYFSGKE